MAHAAVSIVITGQTLTRPAPASATPMHGASRSGDVGRRERVSAHAGPLPSAVSTAR